jgi:hypothetical protein
MEMPEVVEVLAVPVMVAVSSSPTEKVEKRPVIMRVKRKRDEVPDEAIGAPYSLPLSLLDSS